MKCKMCGGASEEYYDPCSFCGGKIGIVDSRDFKLRPLEVLSFGGGVQSSAMLILVHQGVLTRPDVIIFADTGSETPQTMKNVNEQAIPFCRDVLKIPFITARSHHGKLHEYYIAKKNIPVIGMRGCTSEFKIFPVNRIIRETVGMGRNHVLAHSWIGITTDEAKRERKTQFHEWQKNVYPLLRINYSRSKCEKVLKEHGWVVEKSGCFCCCYGGTKHYAKLKKENPELFQIVLEMEAAVKERSDIGLCGFKRVTDMDFTEKIPQSECDPEEGGCFI